MTVLVSLDICAAILWTTVLLPRSYSLPRSSCSRDFAPLFASLHGTSFTASCVIACGLRYLVVTCRSSSPIVRYDDVHAAPVRICTSQSVPTSHDFMATGENNISAAAS
ncbi:hypothetical protein EXIGLDRAFT_721994 [Exidia glandulosa HHB12029]|uniref:Uncharacterized protein n=1 Tax=Exidia glandulosa HHB12029 TaxID=1314781 RepID=A0A166A742_EXIGL|nr:hypothetical protein EXIGLDRAFT_721994 [Exidia glandulosa HHB12029]